jgi:hypothetical protein
MKLHTAGALLTTLMLGSLVTAICGALARFLPGWRPAWLIAACVLVSIEAAVVHHQFRRERMWAEEALRYLAPELLLMVVITRVATTLSLGLRGVEADVRRWLYDPLSIFDAPFIAALILGLLIGLITHATMDNLLTLQPLPSDSPDDRDGSNARLMLAVRQERSAALRQIGGRFVMGGVLLLLALSLESVNIQRLNAPGQPVSLASAGAALAYVISGFLLYSQARLALLRARWQIEGAHVSPLVERRWGRASALLIAGVALAAVLLPRTYGLGILDTIRGALGLLGYIVAVIGYVMIWLLSLLALIPAWLLSLLATDGAHAPPPAQPFIPPEAPPAVHQENLFAALLFWSCMLALVAWAAWVVVQRHPGLLRALARWGPLAALLAWLRGLWAESRAWSALAARTVRERLRRPAPMEVRREIRRLRGLPPRELVRALYRSTLRRAAAGGLPRGRGQTPYEYGARLAAQLPDAEPDVAALTEAFVAAQYSPRPPDGAAARRAVRPWMRLRRRLRQQ